jgi:geranylgeranyl reductase family protein
VRRFDAIVVGAGPAGSLTAYQLATAGASVLLLDRARFPRDKPCGGGLTGRALRLLPFAVDSVVEDVVDRFEFRLRFGSRFVKRGDAPLAVMTQRRRLDAYLAERAAEAGAEFRDGVRVTEIIPDGGGPHVRADGGRIAGDVLVGADGVNGLTVRQLGFTNGYTYGVALEGNASYGAVAERRYRGRAVLELGIVAGGYGWVFAKGDHVNVGVGGWETEGPRLRGLLRRVCTEHGVAADRLSDLRGYRLPLRHPADVPARGRLVLVGDAAGLVDPISGDGMYEAFASARLAADAALDVLAGRATDFTPYVARLRDALEADAAASWAAKLAFDRYPKVTFRLVRLPAVWSFMDRLIRGEVAHVRDAEGFARVPLKALQRLGSAAAERRYTSPSTAA